MAHLEHLSALIYTAHLCVRSRDLGAEEMRFEATFIASGLDDARRAAARWEARRLRCLGPDFEAACLTLRARDVTEIDDQGACMTGDRQVLRIVDEK